MAKRTGNISSLRVGEVGLKKLKNGRVVKMQRIATTGFPQFKIVG